MFSNKISIFLYKRVKVKKICHCYCLTFSHFLFFLPFFQCFLFLLICQVIIRWIESVFLSWIEDFFSFLRRALCSNCKKTKKNQTQIIVFLKKTVVKLLGFRTQRAHYETLLNFVASFSS